MQCGIEFELEEVDSCCNTRGVIKYARDKRKIISSLIPLARLVFWTSCSVVSFFRKRHAHSRGAHTENRRCFKLLRINASLYEAPYKNLEKTFTGVRVGLPVVLGI